MMKSLKVPISVHEDLKRIQKEFFEQNGRKITIIEIIAKSLAKIKAKDLI